MVYDGDDYTPLDTDIAAHEYYYLSLQLFSACLYIDIISKRINEPIYCLCDVRRITQTAYMLRFSAAAIYLLRHWVLILL